MSTIPLDYGNGGQEMQEFLQTFLPNFHRGDWQNSQNDAATLPLPDGQQLVFTTDSFVVNPLEFPGGNIGHLAFAGTVNDLVVMGAVPLGLSCSLIIEEGLDQALLKRVLKAMQDLSLQYKIPIVTGDTKVMERGAVDKLVINTSGVGLTAKILETPIAPGDKIIVSGGIGEHGVALLSERFDFQTDIVSDSKPLVNEMQAISPYIKCAKDPTRGGLAASLNELALSHKHVLEIEEPQIPMQGAVRTAGELLGIDILHLANEGKLVCVAAPKHAGQVVTKLKTFNPQAGIIGTVKKADKKGFVTLNTGLGTRRLSMPSGKIVPRIC